MLSNAVLALLVEATEAGPVLVLVDDLPWLDRASAVVLGVVARRLGGHQVGFLAVSRSGEDGFFDRGGLPVHEVLPLSKPAAAALVGDRFPSLAPRVSQRLLAEAQGNPLALLELPVALSGMQRGGTGPLPAWLPLSRRLQAVFESRITALPARTRHLLLLAALDGTGRLPDPAIGRARAGWDRRSGPGRAGRPGSGRRGREPAGVPSPADPFGGGGAVHQRPAPPGS